MEEPWKFLSGLVPHLGDDDSDEEGGGEYSRYKTKARSAFASPSSLADRLGKRGGASQTSAKSVGAYSRRCKNRFKDNDAADILEQIAGSTGVGKTSATAKDFGLAAAASAKGIVIPHFVSELADTSTVEKHFEQHRDPIGMLITNDSDNAVPVDDDMTHISDAMQ
jgi:hypothetical protein